MERLIRLAILLPAIIALSTFVCAPVFAVDIGTITLINGDADGDNVLTIGDAGLVLWFENVEIGDPNYNPDWDIDGDGVLTIGDAGIILWNENLEGDP